MDRNPILGIEAFRMSGFCHARAGDETSAIERGSLAFEIGEFLQPEARAMTTLPIAAVDVLRVADAPRARALEGTKARLEARLAEALRRAEERAVVLESGGQSATAGQIDADLEIEREEAYAGAEGEMAPIVAEATPTFRKCFERARHLLGPGWPMRIAGALPAVADAGDSRGITS